MKQQTSSRTQKNRKKRNNRQTKNQTTLEKATKQKQEKELATANKETNKELKMLKKNKKQANN